MDNMPSRQPPLPNHLQQPYWFATNNQPTHHQPSSTTHPPITNHFNDIPIHPPPPKTPCRFTTNNTPKHRPPSQTPRRFTTNHLQQPFGLLPTIYNNQPTRRIDNMPSHQPPLPNHLQQPYWFATNQPTHHQPIPTTHPPITNHSNHIPIHPPTHSPPTISNITTAHHLLTHHYVKTPRRFTTNNTPIH